MPAVPITVPGVGESITEGILARWLKADGSSVKSGEPLFELETDKASNVVPAGTAGVLKIQVPEGETVPIGATIGTIDPAGSPTAAAPASPPPAPARPTEAPTRSAEKPSAEKAPAPKSRDSVAAPATSAPASPAPSRPAPAQPSSPSPPPSAQPTDGTSAPLSPAVRRMVSEMGVDLSKIPGTGPGGRITKGDVLAYIDAPHDRQAAPARGGEVSSSELDVASAPAAPTTLRADTARESRKRMSGLRQRIAQRLVEAQHTAAILTTFNEADMSRITELRARYKESFQAKHGVALGFMSFFVKAAVEALKVFPIVNARIDENDIVYQNVYDIGVAVSTERGLMVPVIRDADRRSFAEIEKAIGDFAAKARAGTIAVGELHGGTFTITNGGIFGSLLSTPILNPPQSGILGMHAIKKRPVVVDDQIVIRPMMYLALSYDHRLIDGKDAVSFLVRVKDGIENPERLMLQI